MGFYEDVLAIKRLKSGSICSIGLLLAGDDKDLAEGLSESLANDKVGRAQLSEALKKYGHKISPNTVSRHRLGNCACPTTS